MLFSHIATTKNLTGLLPVIADPTQRDVEGTDETSKLYEWT